MSDENKNLIEVTREGIRARMKSGLGFWQLFALVSLLIIPLTAIAIVALIVLKSSFVLLAGYPLMGVLGYWYSKFLKGSAK